MNYDLMRNSIKDGQIVFFNAMTWPQKLIGLGSGGPFSHVGITVWMTDAQGNSKLMCIESSMGGARLVQLSSYLPRGFTIVDIGLDWETCADSAFNDTGKLHYSMINLVWAGIKSLLETIGFERLAMKFKPFTSTGEICSEFVATLLNENGYPLPDTFSSPNKLYKMLINSDYYIKSLPIDAQGKA